MSSNRRRSGGSARFVNKKGRDDNVRNANHRKDKFRKESIAEPRRRSKQASAFNIWLSLHLWVAVSSLGQLFRSPLSTLMTSFVIAIALALPAGLSMLLSNVQQLTGHWEDSAQISLFLKRNANSDSAQRLVQRIESWPQVDSTRIITPQQALREFEKQSGFASAVKTLGENPLPAVIVVQPKNSLKDPQTIAELYEKLKALKAVDMAQLDFEWIRKLNAIINVAQRGVTVLASLLAIAILLIVGNTIRLTILNRRQEIVVNKLIGATHGFIQRPFLYTGFWYGLFAAIFAWVLLAVSLILLNGPVEELAKLYHSQFQISGLGLELLLTVFLTSIFLGLLGSWLAVGRHLRKIEPV